MYIGKAVNFFDMCEIDTMSMLEIDDMIKELGFATPYNLYWQKPGGILKVSPMRTDSGVLAMLGALPRQKCIHVYIEDKLDTLLTQMKMKLLGLMKMKLCGLIEDDDYVVSNHEDSDNPIKDSENDLADNGDEVCDVHVGVCVGVGRDIPGFSTAMCENEEMDNESDGSDLLQNAYVGLGMLVAIDMRSMLDMKINMWLT
ncbi:hypothetical protein V6N13_111021 [Hibiscus sabdariffa]